MSERIDARTDWQTSPGAARCWLKKHVGNGLGRVVEREEMVFVYAPMRDVWVGWRKVLKDKGDTMLEKVGEFKELP
jgi:hypothetical protein